MRRTLMKLASGLSFYFRVSKRQQFVGVTLLLTLSLVATQLISGGLRFDIFALLVAVSYALSAFVLRQELSGWEYLTLLILPSLYTGAVFLFYFLLPTRWITRVPIATLYAIGMYAILLTENIYNVAAERNIQLLRAAHSVGFLLTLITHFFLIETILSLHLPFYVNALFTALIAFPLSLQALWTMELTPAISTKVWVGSLLVTLMESQLALVISFWPTQLTIAAFFLTTVFYATVGMTQQYLIERLFPKTVREFVAVLILVFVLLIFTTKWGSGGG